MAGRTHLHQRWDRAHATSTHIPNIHVAEEEPGLWIHGAELLSLELLGYVKRTYSNRFCIVVIVYLELRVHLYGSDALYCFLNRIKYLGHD